MLITSYNISALVTVTVKMTGCYNLRLLRGIGPNKSTRTNSPLSPLPCSSCCFICVCIYLFSILCLILDSRTFSIFILFPAIFVPISLVIYSTINLYIFCTFAFVLMSIYLFFTAGKNCFIFCTFIFSSFKRLLTCNCLLLWSLVSFLTILISKIVVS